MAALWSVTEGAKTLHPDDEGDREIGHPLYSPVVHRHQVGQGARPAVAPRTPEESDHERELESSDKRVYPPTDKFVKFPFPAPADQCNHQTLDAGVSAPAVRSPRYTELHWHGYLPPLQLLEEVLRSRKFIRYHSLLNRKERPTLKVFGIFTFGGNLLFWPRVSLSPAGPTDSFLFPPLPSSLSLVFTQHHSLRVSSLRRVSLFTAAQ